MNLCCAGAMQCRPCSHHAAAKLLVYGWLSSSCVPPVARLALVHPACCPCLPPPSVLQLPLQLSRQLVVANDLFMAHCRRLRGPTSGGWSCPPVLLPTPLPSGTWPSFVQSAGGIFANALHDATQRTASAPLDGPAAPVPLVQMMHAMLAMSTSSWRIHLHCSPAEYCEHIVLESVRKRGGFTVRS